MMTTNIPNTKTVIDSGEARASGGEESQRSINEIVVEAISSIPRQGMSSLRECRYGKFRDTWVIVATTSSRATYALHVPSMRFFRTHIGSTALTSAKVREVIEEDRAWLVPLLSKVIPEGATLLKSERTGERVQQLVASPAPPVESHPPMHFDVKESSTILVEYSRTLPLRVDQVTEMVRRNGGPKIPLDKAKLSIDPVSGAVLVTWTDSVQKTDLPADLVQELLGNGSGEE
jgi:hypothetical protein